MNFKLKNNNIYVNLKTTSLILSMLTSQIRVVCNDMSNNFNCFKLLAVKTH